MLKKNIINEEFCAICLEKTQNISKDPYVELKTCGHKFHSTCLGKYIFEFNYKQCPICRKKIAHSNDISKILLLKKLFPGDIRIYLKIFQNLTRLHFATNKIKLKNVCGSLLIIGKLTRTKTVDKILKGIKSGVSTNKLIDKFRK